MEQKLKKRTLFGYALGDGGMGVIGGFISLYLLFFMTNKVGIPLVWASTISLVCGIWDAINDIAVGFLVDKTKNKKGKARPWLLKWMIPLAITTILIFNVPAGLSISQKTLWCATAYFFYVLFYTCINLPYGTLMLRLTNDADERTSLSAARMLGSNICYYGSMAATPFIATAVCEMVGDETVGYGICSIIFSAVSVFMIWMCYMACPERQDIIESDQKEPIKLKDSLKALFSNSQWIIASLSNILLWIEYSLFNVATMYWVVYTLRREETASSIFSMIAMITSFLVIPFIPAILKKVGRKRGMVLFRLIGLVGLIVTLMGSVNYTIAIIGYVLYFVSIQFHSTVIVSTISDTVEYGELLTGVRNEGLAFTSNSFGSKVGPAFANWIGGILLAVAGLDTTLANGVAQSESALTGISVVKFIVPAVLLIIQMILLKWYFLDNEKMKEIGEQLQLRKNAAKAEEVV